jgi:16S rRNA (uracil1498-N3)-methyltransferase
MNIVLFEGETFFSRNDERAKHIQKVLRKKAGDSFFAGIINGAEGTAVITRMDDAGLFFDFSPEQSAKPLFPVTLLVGFPRPIQLKRLLRDAASLGVEAVWLTGTELGEKSYRESTLVSRGAALSGLLEGCMQAGGSMVPELRMFDSADEAIAALQARDAHADFTAVHAGSPAAQAGSTSCRIILDVTEDAVPLLDLASLAAAASDSLMHITLAVGSERGWTANERVRFRDAAFTPASMGHRILRTETACTAAIALVLAKTRYRTETR